MQVVTHSPFNNLTLNEEKNLVVTWDQFEVKNVTLGIKIKLSGWNPRSIIGIGRGGWEVAAALSRIFNIKSGAFMCKSYEADGVCTPAKLKTASDITFVGELEAPVLVVDDLVEKGKTLEATVEFIKMKYKIDDIKSAVLFCKTKAAYIPDYYVDTVEFDRWIFLPNEIYERAALLNLPHEELNALLNKPELISKVLHNLPSNPREKMSMDQMISTLHS